MGKAKTGGEKKNEVKGQKVRLGFFFSKGKRFPKSFCFQLIWEFYFLNNFLSFAPNLMGVGGTCLK